MYAQKLEGESWIGERMDKGKIDKMSGLLFFSQKGHVLLLRRSAKCWPFQTDQQLGQLYELMQAIQKSAAEEGDGESNQS